MSIPNTETERLIVREFVHEDADARRQLMVEAFDNVLTPAQNEQWMAWTVLSYREFANLHQPPYGDYAIALKATGELVGSVGLVPSVISWGVLPTYRAAGEAPNTFTSPEYGLFWAISTAQRGKGYATEAAQPIIDFAFNQLNARRIVATTEHHNLASQRVMSKLGMTLEHNPGTEPFWFEVIGVLGNPRLRLR